MKSDRSDESDMSDRADGANFDGDGGEITFGRIFGEIWIWVDFVEWGKLCKFAGDMKNYAWDYRVGL